MSFLGGPDAPAAPDPNALIDQQARANFVNQYNPYGSSQYTQGQNGQWSQNVTLNPYLQAQLGNQQALGAYGSNAALGMFGNAYNSLNQPFQAGQINSSLNYTPLDLKAFGGNDPVRTQFGMQNSVGNPQAATGFRTGPLANTDPNQFNIDAYFNKVYEPMAQTIGKEQGRSNSALDAQLAAQGIALGSEAYKNAHDIQNEGNNDALTRARTQAYGQALGASQNAFGQALNSNQNTFGQGLAQANYYNQGIGQNFNQALQGGQFANSAQNQQFNQGLANAGLGQAGNAQYLQAQGQGFNQALAGAGFGNQAQQQGFNQGLQQRYMPFQDIQSLNGLYQAPNQQFAQPNSPNVLGAYGLQQQALQNGFNQQNANYQSNLGGLVNIAGGLMSMYGNRQQPQQPYQQPYYQQPELASYNSGYGSGSGNGGWGT